MRRLSVLSVAIATVALLPGPAAASHWISANCYIDNQAVSAISRSTARVYALVALYEGYEWGGGCWNADNVDNTPNAPDSGGEGPDCSGLVFKSWHLRSVTGAHGFRWWNKLQNVHGPYSSYSFYGPSSSWPFFLIGKTKAATQFMDAFAKQGHVGLIYSEILTSTNTDNIIEAYNDSSGVRLTEQGYRGSSLYRAVRREAWAS